MSNLDSRLGLCAGSLAPSAPTDLSACRLAIAVDIYLRLIPALTGKCQCFAVDENL